MLRHAASLTRRSSLASSRFSLATTRFGVRQLSSVIVAGDEAGYKKAVDTEGLCVIYFTASWCGPCRMISPIYEQLSTEHPSATFVKVDVDELPEVAAESQVSAMPTFLIVKERRLLDTIVGANEGKLRDSVAQHAN